ADAAREKGLQVWTEAEVAGVTGSKSLREVSIRRRNGGGTNGFAADLLCISGGLNPSVQLASMTRAALVWNSDLAAFVPGAPLQAERSVGAARGILGVAAAASDGAAAGAAAAKAAGFQESTALALPGGQEPRTTRIEAFWEVKAKGKAFVDL